MPGISFVFDRTGDLAKKGPAILQSLDSIIDAEHYERKALLNGRFCFLGFTKYEEYLITTFQNDDFLVCLEGQIYGKDHSTIKKELTRLTEYMFQPNLEGKGEITSWLLDTDGEFIIFALHKQSNDIGIINDALGRLSFYYHNGNGIFIGSREIRFVHSLIKDRKFDKMAIAQHLLFGYSLGERTLLENIYRLQPITLIRVSNAEKEIKMYHLHRYNFEIKKYRDKKIEDNASELISLFSEACKNRAKSNVENIVSLSGGLDSRSVAVCLHNNGIPFHAVTYLDCKRTVKAEVEVAEQLSQIFNLDFRILQLSNPKGKDLLQLLRMKNGLNCLAMGFLLLYLKGIKKHHSSRGNHLLTGDGGDHLLRDKRPYRNLRDLDGLVKYILSENGIFPLEEVATLTQIQRSRLIDEIKSHVLSYPEKDWNQKYVHFDIFDRGFKWSVEGEDRNRFFFWSVAPFYSPKFFNYAMNCPDEQKSRYTLYRNFLLELSPEASAIKNANWNLPITSLMYKIRSSLTNVIFRFFPLMLSKRKVNNLVKNTGSYDHRSTFISCFQNQINNCDAIGEYLSHPALKQVVRKCNNYSKRQIQVLFTVVSSIEEIECQRSTIEKFYESEFE